MDSTDRDEIPVERAVLQQLVIKLLQRKGMFAAEAEIVADRMIEADSHGQHRCGVGSLPVFLEAMDLGDIDPRARTIVVSDTPATTLIDGSSGMGHVAVTRAMLMASEKAVAVGTGAVVIKNSRPAGSLDVIARLGASRGLITLTAASHNPMAEQSQERCLAWAIPGPQAGAPILRQERQESDDAFPLLFSLLTAGLAAADPFPRKQKLSPAANTVEYSVLAIDPDKFGCRDSLTTKWSSLWEKNTVASQSEGHVSLDSSIAGQLRELATKIKFQVTW